MGLTWPAGRRHARQLSRTEPARGWALVLTSAAFFMVALDALVVITALPAIHHDLGGSMSTLEWTVNAYTLSFAAGIITAAAIGDRLGRRRVYVAGLLLFTAASAACALAPSAGTLIAARAVQGIGAAIVTPLSLTILTVAWPAQRRGRAGRLRRLGAARPRADAAWAAAADSRLHRRQRHRIPPVGGAVLGRLPCRAVLPARPGFLPARRRAAVPALDSHPGRDRAA